METGAIAILGMDLFIIMFTILSGNPMIFFAGQMIGFCFLVLIVPLDSLKNLVCLYLFWMIFPIIPKVLRDWMMD